MCRHLAYLGPPVTLDTLVMSQPWSLRRQSFEPRFQTHGRINADGFGIGWYDFERRREPARTAARTASDAITPAMDANDRSVHIGRAVR